MEIQVINPEQIYLCETDIEKIGDGIARYIKLCSKGHFDHLDEIFLEIVENLGNFIKASSTLKNYLKNNESFTKESPFVVLQFQLLGLLNRLSQAKQRNDLSLIMDIMEYELLENLIHWKLDVLETMKSIK
jgi:hypothetical protein